MSTSIKARYENGVFRPLEDVDVKEGTEADVYLREQGSGGQRKKSFKETEAYGMWAGRKDIGDSVEYVNRLRKPRWKRSE